MPFWQKNKYQWNCKNKISRNFKAILEDFIKKNQKCTDKNNINNT